MHSHLRIDVGFDLICPWCWIGKQYLEQALALFAEAHPSAQVEVHWHSVPLLPQVPTEGWPFAAFYERRLGSARAVQERQQQVLLSARAVGLEIDFARIQTFPNTVKAHRLLAHARAQLTASAFSALLQHLFIAYFQQGRNLGDPIELAAIAKNHAVNLNGLASIPEAPGLEALAASGVPYFTFNRHQTLSGAQPAELLLAAMQRNWRTPVSIETPSGLSWQS